MISASAVWGTSVASIFGSVQCGQLNYVPNLAHAMFVGLEIVLLLVSSHGIWRLVTVYITHTQPVSLSLHNIGSSQLYVDLEFSV